MSKAKRACVRDERVREDESEVEEDLDAADDDKQAQRRQRNREAARRVRERRANQLAAAKEQVDNLRNENQRLLALLRAIQTAGGSLVSGLLTSLGGMSLLDGSGGGAAAPAIKQEPGASMVSPGSAVTGSFPGCKTDAGLASGQLLSSGGGSALLTAAAAGPAHAAPAKPAASAPCNGAGAAPLAPMASAPAGLVLQDDNDEDALVTLSPDTSRPVVTTTGPRRQRLTVEDLFTGLSQPCLARQDSVTNSDARVVGRSAPALAMYASAPVKVKSTTASMDVNMTEADTVQSSGGGGGGENVGSDSCAMQYVAYDAKGQPLPAQEAAAAAAAVAAAAAAAGKQQARQAAAVQQQLQQQQQRQAPPTLAAAMSQSGLLPMHLQQAMQMGAAASAAKAAAASAAAAAASASGSLATMQKLQHQAVVQAVQQQVAAAKAAAAAAAAQSGTVYSSVDTAASLQASQQLLSQTTSGSLHSAMMQVGRAPSGPVAPATAAMHHSMPMLTALAGTMTPQQLLHQQLSNSISTPGVYSTGVLQAAMAQQMSAGKPGMLAAAGVAPGKQHSSHSHGLPPASGAQPSGGHAAHSGKPAGTADANSGSNTAWQRANSAQHAHSSQHVLQRASASTAAAAAAELGSCLVAAEELDAAAEMVGAGSWAMEFGQANVVGGAAAQSAPLAMQCGDDGLLPLVPEAFEGSW